jgi:adenylosuccinate lyase
MIRLLSGIEVNVDRMRKNLNMLHGVVFSQSVLLALVNSAGMSRDDAYRIVQEDARLAIEQERPFEDVLGDDSRVTLSAKQLSDAFDVARVLRNAGRAVDAAASIAKK